MYQEKVFPHGFVKNQDSVCGEVIMKNIATPQPFDDFLRRAFFYNSSRTLFRNFDKYLIHVVLVLVFHKVIATAEIVLSLEIKS